jgi:hypothetical protein
MDCKTPNKLVELIDFETNYSKNYMSLKAHLSEINWEKDYSNVLWLVYLWNVITCFCLDIKILFFTYENLKKKFKNLILKSENEVKEPI